MDHRIKLPSNLALVLFPAHLKRKVDLPYSLKKKDLHA